MMAKHAKNRFWFSYATTTNDGSNSDVGGVTNLDWEIKITHYIFTFQVKLYNHKINK